jgi:hypothetical protein
MRKPFMLAPAALAACTATPPPADGGTCAGGNLGQFAGRTANQDLGSEILRVSGARVIRWVAKGMMVTMDYREDRVTVWLTADNRVERATCG